MVTCLSDAGLNDVALVAEPFFGPAQDESQLRQVMAAGIGEFHALEVVPDAFVRMQLRGVPRQLLQVQACGLQQLLVLDVPDFRWCPRWVERPVGVL